jgi:hypothetical protein
MRLYADTGGTSKPKGGGTKNFSNEGAKRHDSHEYCYLPAGTRLDRAPFPATAERNVVCLRQRCLGTWTAPHSFHIAFLLPRRSIPAMLIA